MAEDSLLNEPPRQSHTDTSGSSTPRKWPSPSARGLQYNLQAGWKTWPEFGLRLDNLPLNVTTSQLWGWFSHEGEIAYMDIFQDRGSDHAMSAKIKFEPPPKNSFWNTGKYRVTHPDKGRYPCGLSIAVSAWRSTPMLSIQSPVSADRRYPVKIVLNPLAIQFGTLTGPKRLNIMKSISVPVGDNSLETEINLRLKHITVLFPVNVETRVGKEIRMHKVVIEFTRIKAAYPTPGEDQTMGLVLALKFPARYYWKRKDITNTFTDEAKNWDSNETWYRATEILEQVGVPLVHPAALYTEYNDPEFIDIGRWTTIRLIIGGKYKSNETSIHEEFINALEDFGVLSRDCDDFVATQGEKPQLWDLLEHPTLLEEGNALHLLSLSAASPTNLPFEVRYQLEVCLSRGLLNEQTISVDFLRELASIDATRARLVLEYVADQNELIQDPMSLFRDLSATSYFPDVRVPYYCALIRKAIITPTTIRYSSPTVEMSHRVLRRYNNLHDRFLRIQFTEEGEAGRIKVNREQNDEIWKRLLRTLFQGIKIGDRLYEFLAFGSSQLRQSGAYFFCPTDHISCDDIRKWMGKFDHIRVVAKYSARLGQCLSTTREIRGISVPNIRPIQDIERNGYCFTDGVGKISQFLAHMIIEDMHLDVYEKPALFQFRMGGCKGVLAVWPDAKGTEVHVRASQQKFTSEFNGLEIIRCARFATATLNRQTITILEHLGVPPTAFLALLEHQLRAYELAMKDNTVAIGMLRKLVDENQTTLALAELLEAGFKTENTQEPFVLNVLHLWRSWSLKLLKEKSRIHVEKSAFVLGCVDETGTLRGHSRETEGKREKTVESLPQIFIQITNCKDYDKTTIIKGVCLVGRNPSLHPGDIRIVEAVDEPKLHHLKDVVVFPSTGDRPVPNMLSGGDLDGDDFFVMWDSSLMPRIWNWPPMDYTGSKPRQLDRDVNVDDLRNFFVKYMKNDVLPLIATSHLAMADSKGPADPICLQLANLHSQAVDYPKTGEPAVLKRHQQPRKWPHFMEKKSSYHSHKALGQIYDKVVNNAVQFKPVWDRPFDRRITNHETVKPGAEMLEAAKRVKVQYDTSVRRLLSQHDLQTEFELWTGFSMSRPKVGSEYKRQEDLGHEYDVLRQRFREVCYEAAGGKHPEVIDRFVVAMYIVTEEETKTALNLNGQSQEPASDAGHAADITKVPMISFPWIFHWALIRLAGGKDKSGHSNYATARPKGKTRPELLFDEHAKVRSHGQDGGEVDTVQSDVGSDIQAKLPDGTVIHQGQPLILFDDQELASPEPPNQDTNRDAPSTNGKHEQVSSSNGLGDMEPTVEEKQGACEKQLLEDNAMDRLARLIEDGEE